MGTAGSASAVVRPRPSRSAGPRSRSPRTTKAHVTYLGPEESQLGYKESMKDTARVLGRMFDSGATLTITDEIDAAVAGADFLYTDVWRPWASPPGSGTSGSTCCSITR
jgi:hypothetical protein